MFNLKKAMASVVIAAMLASNASFVFAQVPTDVVDTKYEESVQVLNSLGILKGYEDGTFKPENTITRAEFTAVITRAIGLSKNVEGAKGATIYTDVAADHWATGNINLASQQLIISGYGDGKFGPEDPVTYEQAIKMIVACLGYTPAAEANGGYPNGYIFQATDLGITKGATAAGNSPATRGIVAKIVFNALDVKMMEQTSYGNKTTYEAVEKTLLSEKLKVEKVTSKLVTGNYMTKLTGSTAVRKGYVELSDKDGKNAIEYKVGDTNATEYLGYVVDYYVSVDEDSDLEDTLIAINKATGQNDELTINARNISSTDPNKNEIEYWVDKEKDTDTKTLDLENDGSVYVIEDGKFKDDDFTYTTADLAAPVQKLRLVDFDTDGKYDIVFVYKVKSYIVESVSSDGLEIETDGPDTVSLDPDGREKEFTYSIVDKDGKSLKATDIQVGDIISVSSDNYDDYSDAKWIDIVVSKEKVTGRVDEIDDGDDNDPNTPDDLFVIGGKKYYKSVACDDQIKLGDEGTFSVDAYNNIIDFKLGARSVENYGYLINAAIYDDMDDTIQFEVFNSKGETDVYLAALKIKLFAPNNTYKDGVMMDLTKSDDLNAVINSLKQSSAIKKQLIYFKLNSDNKVNELDLAFDSAFEDFDDVQEFRFSKDDELTKKFKAFSDGKSGSLDSYEINEDTLIFYVPTAKDDDDYELIKPSRLKNDKEYKNVQIFDADDDTPKAIVITQVLPLDETENVAVVDHITKSKTEKGDDNYKVYAYVSGKLESIPSVRKDDGDISGIDTLQKGDVIQYDLNNKGEMRNFALLYDRSANAKFELTSPYESNKYELSEFDEQELVYGEVYDKDSSIVKVGLALENETEKYKIKDAKVYLYDEQYDRLTAESGTSEIKKGRDIFIRIYDDNATDILIIKRNGDN